MRRNYDRRMTGSPISRRAILKDIALLPIGREGQLPESIPLDDYPKELVLIAGQEDNSLTVFAQTLPEENASTSILKKLGFALVGSVDHPEDGTVWGWQINATTESPELME